VKLFSHVFVNIYRSAIDCIKLLTTQVWLVNFALMIVNVNCFFIQPVPWLPKLLSSRYQDVFAMLFPSCCDKSGTSCYHLVTRLMTVTDLLQVVPTRLIQAVRNKLLRACCHQLVASLLASSTLLQDDNNLFQTFQQLGTSSANTACWQTVRFLRM
jgi:hypothetical protein